MKTHFGNNEYARKVAQIQTQAMHIYPPPIPFARKQKKKSEDDDKTKYKNMDMLLGVVNDDTTEWKVQVFERGDPEEWIKWRIQWTQLVEGYPLNTYELQH